MAVHIELQLYRHICGLWKVNNPVRLFLYGDNKRTFGWWRWSSGRCYKVTMLLISCDCPFLPAFYEAVAVIQLLCCWSRVTVPFYLLSTRQLLLYSYYVADLVWLSLFTCCLRGSCCYTVIMLLIPCDCPFLPAVHEAVAVIQLLCYWSRVTVPFYLLSTRQLEDLRLAWILRSLL